MILSAKDVLKLFLELTELSPNIDEWDEKHFSDNPPRFYRFRQLKILFDVYSLGSFKDFINGDFIENRPLEQFKQLIIRVNQLEKEYLPEESLGNYTEKNNLDHFMLEYMFKYLMSYRLTLNKALNFNGGVLEFSGLFRFAIFQIGHLNEVIHKEVISIDEILSFIISPGGESFSVDELVSKYGFPNVDIKEIDNEWI